MKSRKAALLLPWPSQQALLCLKPAGPGRRGRCREGAPDSAELCAQLEKGKPKQAEQEHSGLGKDSGPPKWPAPHRPMLGGFPVGS